MLEGLAQKLFVDDYRYAARATGLLDPENAEKAYTDLRANLDALAKAPMVDGYSAMPAYGTIDSLSEHYAKMLEATNPAYRQVWDVVADVDPSGQTDLYKDALAYTVLHSQIDEWVEDMVAQQEKVWSSLTEIHTGDKLTETIQQHIDASEVLVDAYRELQRAYGIIFAERFAMRGADPNLVTKLSNITASNIGPELKIP
jgi:hypothetical protein